MGRKACIEMRLEPSISTDGSITIEGPWVAPDLKDHAFPIFIGERKVGNIVGTTKASIDNTLKLEIEFIDESKLSDDVVGTFEVPMIFHVRKQ